MTAYCTGAELGYRRERTRFAPGAGLALDPRYRLAHLPLVAPDHPRVIPSLAGTPYDRGRHPPARSIVLPIPAEALEAAPAYRALEAALRAAPFAGKVAWDLLPRRRDRLHATLCGVSDGPAPAPDRLAGLGSLAVELRGLFSGSVNVGRLYLTVHPERRVAENAVHAVQAALGRPPSDLALVGIWNLVDDLDPGEAAALGALIDAWWERPILRLTVDALWLLSARDDLVLDSEIEAVLPLTG